MLTGTSLSLEDLEVLGVGLVVVAGALIGVKADVVNGAATGVERGARIAVAAEVFNCIAEEEAALKAPLDP